MRHFFSFLRRLPGADNPVTLASAVLLCLCLLLVPLIYLKNLREDLYRDTVSDVTALIEESVNGLDASITFRRKMLTDRAHFLGRDGQRRDPQEALEQLRRATVRDEDDGLLTYALIAPDGQAAADSGQRFDAGDEEGFRRAMAGEIWLSQPLYSRSSGQKIIAMYAPVFYSDGPEAGTERRPDAVLRISQPVDSLYRTASLALYGGRTFSYITDREGRLLIGSASNLGYLTGGGLFEQFGAEADPALLEPLRQNMARGVKTYTVLPFKEGHSYFFAVLPLAATGGTWMHVTGIPEDILRESTNGIIFRASLLCLFIVILLGAGVALVWREKSKAQRRMTRLALEDALTGLPNANALEEQRGLYAERVRKACYVMAVFDIDAFKIINDSFGKERGDQVLKSVAAVLARHCDPRRETMARLSRDVFALIALCPSGETRQMPERMEKLFRAINDRLLRDRTLPAPVRFSCGFCTLTEEIVLKGQWYDYADLARQTVKQHRADTFAFFSADMLTRLHAEREMEKCMEQALADGEFTIRLQPKVDMPTGRVVGAEALVRWDRPGRDTLPPGDFLPFFEKNGFVVKLDYHVLERVCELKRDWRRNGLPDYKISVNMSRKHLGDPLFVPTLRDIAARYDVDPASVEIELTESFFHGDELLLPIAKAIKNSGFGLSMDDFGSGYSTLNMLRKIPIDELKFDKQFLEESDLSSRTRDIMASLLDMALKIGVDVVCEGVETAEQVRFLLGIGGRIAQGYFYARPLTVPDFEALAATEQTPGAPDPDGDPAV